MQRVPHNTSHFPASAKVDAYLKFYKRKFTDFTCFLFFWGGGREQKRSLRKINKLQQKSLSKDKPSHAENVDFSQHQSLTATVVTI